jgi:hypothetical protein
MLSYLVGQLLTLNLKRVMTAIVDLYQDGIPIIEI